MDEQAFNEKYTFQPLKIVTVVNPRAEDFIFGATVQEGVDLSTGRVIDKQRTYRVPAGGRERLPGNIANMYLDQMTKLLAQDDEKIQFIIDPALRAQYYDQLIVDSEDLTETYQPHPQYLDRPEEVAVNETAEVPFAGKDSNESQGDTSTPKRAGDSAKQTPSRSK